MDSFFPKTSNLGFFIACSAAVLATHTGVFLLGAQLTERHRNVLTDPEKWKNSVATAAVADTMFVAPALAAYSFYNQNKKKS